MHWQAIFVIIQGKKSSKFTNTKMELKKLIRASFWKFYNKMCRGISENQRFFKTFSRKVCTFPSILQKKFFLYNCLTVCWCLQMEGLFPANFSNKKRRRIFSLSLIISLSSYFQIPCRHRTFSERLKYVQFTSGV